MEGMTAAVREPGTKVIGIESLVTEKIFGQQAVNQGFCPAVRSGFRILPRASTAM